MCINYDVHSCFTDVNFNFSIMCYVAVNFTQVPSSQEVFVDELAEFHCRHPTAIFMTWAINGSASTLSDIVSSTTIGDDGSLMGTLTIPARLEYNGTEVQCVAVIDGSRLEQSPVALLQGLTAIITSTKIISNKRAGGEDGAKSTQRKILASQEGKRRVWYQMCAQVLNFPRF